MGNFIDRLEVRRLLAGATASLTEGVLRVAGTDAAERIVIYTAAQQASRLHVDVDGVTIFTGSTSGGQLQEVMVDGGAGGDSIELLRLPVGGYVLGGFGDDTLIGSDHRDNLVGAAGHDWIDAGGGDDRVDGGVHGDTILGNDGDDRIYGGLGHDVIEGGGGSDRAWAGEHNDTLVGGGSVDILRGGDGDDDLHGGDGDDRLYGDAGNDRLDGNQGDEKLYGGAGDDWLMATAAGSSDALPGSRLFSGGEGDDTIDYSQRITGKGVAVSLDGLPNDGAIERVLSFDDNGSNVIDHEDIERFTGDLNFDGYFSVEDVDMLADFVELDGHRDFNGDGETDIEDLRDRSREFREKTISVGGDVNGDGRVDAYDIWASTTTGAFMRTDVPYYNSPVNPEWRLPEAAAGRLTLDELRPLLPYYMYEDEHGDLRMERTFSESLEHSGGSLQSDGSITGTRLSLQAWAAPTSVPHTAFIPFGLVSPAQGFDFPLDEYDAEAAAASPLFPFEFKASKSFDSRTLPFGTRLEESVIPLGMPVPVNTWYSYLDFSYGYSEEFHSHTGQDVAEEWLNEVITVGSQTFTSVRIEPQTQTLRLLDERGRTVELFQPEHGVEFLKRLDDNVGSGDYLTLIVNERYPLRLPLQPSGTKLIGEYESEVVTSAGREFVLSDIERVIGTSRSDVLIGSPRVGNVLIGGRGHDRLVGVGGANRLEGGWGIDTVAFLKTRGSDVLDKIEHEDFIN